jgi:hypothetical protein
MEWRSRGYLFEVLRVGGRLRDGLRTEAIEPTLQFAEVASQLIELLESVHRFATS